MNVPMSVGTSLGVLVGESCSCSVGNPVPTAEAMPAHSDLMRGKRVDSGSPSFCAINVRVIWSAVNVWVPAGNTSVSVAMGCGGSVVSVERRFTVVVVAGSGMTSEVLINGTSKVTSTVGSMLNTLVISVALTAPTTLNETSSKPSTSNCNAARPA